MPDTDLTAELDDIRVRVFVDNFDDAPRLLAAVEAVLEEHRPVNRGEGLEPTCGTCHKGFWPCPTYLAISREITGKEESDAPH